jgi:hypothetical protein
VSTMTKVFVVLTAVVSIVISSLTISTAARWTNQKESLEKYQQAYQAEFVQRMNAEATMHTKLAVMDDEVRKLEQLRAQRDAELQKVNDQLAAARNDLARRTNEAVAAEAGRKKLEEILDVQTAELTSTQKQNQVLLAQNIDLQTRNQRLASRNLELTGQLTISVDENGNLQEKLYAAEQMNRELQQASSSGRRVASASPAPAGATPVAAPVAGPISGEVVGVDGGYVSINIGETSGVTRGMAFMIYRGQQYVGDFQIENVRPKEAGGKVTLMRPGQQVQAGDRVVYGLEGN